MGVGGYLTFKIAINLFCARSSMGHRARITSRRSRFHEAFLKHLFVTEPQIRDVGRAEP